MADAKVTQKIVFKGTLQLDSPLVISSGTEAENRKNEADIQILKDKLERPFIPGTSLAGVLRDWLSRQDAGLTDCLFGFVDKKVNNREEVQSAVAISDVILEDTVITVRDGVSIDTYTGTGIKGRKYDYEALERGARGKFSMTLTVREYQERMIPSLEQVICCLADRLYTGLRVGALTTKGFGQVSVPDVTAYHYDFKNKRSVMDWLQKKPSSKQYKGRRLEEYTADSFVVDGEFALRTSLLVRDQNVNEKEGKSGLNAVPMKSRNAYLVPGTSLKGVLRHHAEKILDIVGKPAVLLDGLMGYANEKENKGRKSRFIVNETYFTEGVRESEQPRIRIDRFTGGTMEGALFTNKALWQKKEGVPVLKLHFEISGCKDWEAGLALFLLKDLWCGKVALGGEKSIGRGALQGYSATIAFKGKHYAIGPNGNIVEGSREELEQLAAALTGKKEAAEA